MTIYWVLSARRYELKISVDGVRFTLIFQTYRLSRGLGTHPQSWENSYTTDKQILWTAGCHTSTDSEESDASTDSQKTSYCTSGSDYGHSQRPQTHRLLRARIPQEFGCYTITDSGENRMPEIHKSNGDLNSYRFTDSEEKTNARNHRLRKQLGIADLDISWRVECYRDSQIP